MKKNIVQFYKNYYEKKVFLSKYVCEENNFFIMYTNDKDKELDNFIETFVYYLPAYVSNKDRLEVVFEVLKEQGSSVLKEESVNLWNSSEIIPHREASKNGIFGELFLDFYSRVVLGKKFLITYSSKGAFNYNVENRGFDQNYYYFNDDEDIVVIFSESKFVVSLSSAKKELLTDIHGDSSKKGHLTYEYMNRYMKFIIEKGSYDSYDEDENRKKVFEEFIKELNLMSIQEKKEYIKVLIEKEIKIEIVLFAIYKDNRFDINLIQDVYKELYKAAIISLTEAGFSSNNVKINIVFIPTHNDSMTIKSKIEGELKNHE